MSEKNFETRVTEAEERALYRVVQDWAEAFVRAQSCGEWGDEQVESDAKLMANQIVERLPLWAAALARDYARREG